MQKKKITYYHDFLHQGKATPRSERDKFYVGDIWMNRVKCNKCGDILTSKHKHDFQLCKCGAVYVDGGSHYQRIGGSPGDYTNMVEYFDDVCFVHKTLCFLDRVKLKLKSLLTLR